MIVALKHLDAFPDLSEVDDGQIHALAWAMVEGVLDSQVARLTLLHAAAMLKASIAIAQPDPMAAVADLLAEHSQATVDLTETALQLRSAHN